MFKTLLRIIPAILLTVAVTKLGFFVGIGKFKIIYFSNRITNARMKLNTRRRQKCSLKTDN